MEGSKGESKAEVISVLDTSHWVNAHEALKGEGPVSLPPAAQTVVEVHPGTIRATISEAQQTYDISHDITQKQ